MPDLSTGLIPTELKGNFQPDNIPTILPSELPQVEMPDFTKATSGTGSKGSDSSDFVSDGLQKFSQSKPSFETQSSPTFFDYKETGAAMYKGANQFQQYGLQFDGSNEETYGKLQTGWDRTTRALGGAWALTKNQFTEQLSSWGDTFNFLKDNKSAFEKSDMDEINQQQSDLQDKYRIFHTAKDDSTIFNWANLADTVQQSGYALGAMTEVLAEEAALSALTAITLGGASVLEAARSAGNAVTLGRMFKKVAEFGQVTNEVGRARKIFNSINEVNPFFDNSLHFMLDAKNLHRTSEVAGESAPLLRTIGKGFGAFYRDMREVNAAVAEAKAEAAGTNQDITKQLTNQYRKDNGKDPLGDALAQINETAMKAAQTDGIWNTYLIMTTNKIGMGNIMSGIKPLRALEEITADKILTLSDKAALKAGGGTTMSKIVDATENKWLAFKQNIVRKPLTYFKTNIDEALQENLQDVIKDGTTNYYAAKYNQNNGVTDPMKELHDYMLTAGGNQFTVQGAKTFLSGFFTGALIAPVNHLVGNAGNIKQFITDKKGYDTRQEKIKTDRTQTISDFNEIYNNPLNFGYKMGDSNFQANFAELLKANAQSNDKKGFNDIKDDATRHLIMTGIKSGALDTMLERYKNLPEKLSKEEFATAFGIENTPENLIALNSQLDDFVIRAKEVKDIHERVADKFRNPFNIYHDRFKDVDKTTDPKYIKELVGHSAWNDAVNNLVFMKDYYNQNIKRSTSILTAISSKEGFKDVSFNDVHLLTSLDNISGEVDMLDQEIKGLKTSPDAASKKLLGQKQARLSILEKYHEHLSKWQDEFDEHSTLPEGDKRTIAFAKSFKTFQQKAAPLFGELVNHTQKDQGRGLVSKDNVDSAFVNIHDYMKAQKESGIVLDKINLLADPANFHEFFNNHNDESRYWYQKAVNDQKIAQENSDPKVVAENQKKEDNRVAAELVLQKQAEADMIAAKKVEDDKRADADKELIHVQKEEEAIQTAETKKYEQGLREAKDIEEKAAIEKEHQEKLAISEKLKQDAIAAHELTLKTAAEETAKLEAAQKAAADERAAKVEQDKKTAETAAKKKIQDEKDIATHNEKQAALLQAEQERIANDKKIQDAIKTIQTANEDELKMFVADHMGDKVVTKPAVQAAYELRKKELAAVVAVVEPLDEAQNYDDIEKHEQFLIETASTPHNIGMKAENSNSTTGKEDLPSGEIDPDPVKRLFYKTLDKLRNLTTNFNTVELVPGRQGIRLTVVNPTKLFTESSPAGTRLNALGLKSLEKSTVDNIAKRTYKIEDYMQSAVAVITDNAGVPYNFDENGEVSKDGAVITVNLRKPYLDNGTYRLKNSFGDQVQSPFEIASRIIKAGGLNIDGKPTMDRTAITDAVTAQQQAEFKLLFDIRQHLKDNLTASFPLPIVSITDGAINMDFSNPIKISEFKIPDFQLDVIKDNALAVNGKKLGGVYFNIPGYSKDILMVRPRISENQIQTIVQLLTDPKDLSAADVLGYLNTLVYTKKDDIQFFIEKNKAVAKFFDDEKMITVTPEFMDAFVRKLETKKMNISKDKINESFDDISIVDGKLKVNTINYNDFVKNNFETYIQPNEEGKVVPLNSYIKFDTSEIVIGENKVDPIKATSIDPKIDIERRRQDELANKILSKRSTRDFEIGKPLSDEHLELYDTINTKYDAELAALNEPVDQMTQLNQLEDEHNMAWGALVKDMGEALRKLKNGDIRPTAAQKKRFNALDKKFEADVAKILGNDTNPTKTSIITKTVQEKNKSVEDFIDGLMKISSIDNTATLAQIKSAEAWWSNSPLSKHIPLHQMMSVVNSSAIATWTQQGITLFSGANSTDIYHEVFHGFSQLFLTKEQKTNLYNEARIVYPGLTDLEAEELLAEDFRKYILSDGKKVLDQRPVRNTIWRKIMNFLRELFGGVQYLDNALQTETINKIKETYDQLRTGNIKNISPSVYNIQFGKLNKGLEFADGTILSNSESIMVKDTIDSIITSTIQATNIRRLHKGLASTNILLLNENKQFIGALRQVIQKKFEDKLVSGNDYQKLISKQILDNFQATLNYHKNKSEFMKSSALSIQEYDKDGNIVEKIQEGDEKETRDSAFNKEGGRLSVEEHGEPEVFALIAGLFKIGKDGKHEMNELGEPKLVDFAKTKNKVLKTIVGFTNENDMYKALLNATDKNPEFAQLAVALGDPSSYDNNRLKHNLWMKVRQTYALTRTPINQMLLQVKDDKLEDIVLLESKPGIQKVKQQFTSNFQSIVDSPYVFTNTDGKNELNVEKLLNAFTTPQVTEKGIPYITIDDNQEIPFLKALGFNFSDKPQIIDSIKTFKKLNYIALKLQAIANSNQSITDPIKQLETDIRNDKGVVISKGESNNIAQLLSLEAQYSDDQSNFSVVNPNGDQVYELSEYNGLMHTAAILNDSVNYKTYNDLIQSRDGYRFDINRNPLMNGNLIMNSLFDMETGERRTEDDSKKFVTVNVLNLGGAKITTDDANADSGVAMSGLDMEGKQLFDMNASLSTGIESTPQHEAKSSYYGFKVSKQWNGEKYDSAFGYMYFPMKSFVTKGRLDTKITEYLKKGLIGELTRTGWLNEGLNSTDPKVISKGGADIEGYNKRARSLTFFDGMLTQSTKEKLLKMVEKNAPVDIKDQVEEMTDLLHTEFKNYFANLTTETYDQVKNNFIIGEGIMDKLSKYLASTDQKKQDNSSIIDKRMMLTKAYTINSFVAKMESYRVFYGDPAFYNLEKEEANKRIAGFGSTKSTLSLSAGSIDYVNKFLGRPYSKKLGITEKHFDCTFDTRIYQDVEAVSALMGTIEAPGELRTAFTEYFTKRFGDSKNIEDIKTLVEQTLKPYTDMKEGDAQGWITLDAWRIAKDLQGQWNDEIEKLYQKEINGEELTGKELDNFFAIIKAQYTGPLQTEYLFVPGFHKYSLMPLLPSMIKGTSLEAINRDMLEQGHDYATFVSGSKIAIIGKPQPLYIDQKDRIPNITKPGEVSKFVTNTINLRYFGEQLAIVSKWKDEVIFSTQLRKLIDLGLYDKGVAISTDAFEKSENFRSLINQLTALKKEQLIKEAKLELKDGHYVINDFGPIVKMIKREFEKRDMPDHVIDFIDLTTDNKIKTSLDLSTQTQKIEDVIQSIINNRLIRQKVNGEPLIQLAGTGYEKFRNATTEEKVKYKSTNDLPFYQKEGRILSNGTKVTSAMKIKIALRGDYLQLLNFKHSDGKVIGTIDRLNKVIKDENWLNQGDNRKILTLTGVRIPVQGLNSMEFMEVFEFLPSTAGNVIIPASEIVAKSGSDFDVDKLTVFKANLYSNIKYNYKTSDLKRLEVEHPELDFSEDNVDIIIDAKKDNESVYELTNEDQQVYDILTENFASKVYTYANGNNIQGVENKLSESIRSILEMDHNYIDLMKPNTTKDIEPMSDDLAKRNIGYKSNISKVTGEAQFKTKDGKQVPVVSATNLIEPVYNHQQYIANNNNKSALGIEAVDNTFNNQFNKVGAYLESTYKDNKGINVPVEIHLLHNKMLVNGKELISLSHLDDASKLHRIADILQQLMNGSVDAGKKAWKFNINGGSEAASVILLLTQVGAPIEDISNFMTQPVVQEYTKLLRTKGNIFSKANNPENYKFFEGKQRIKILAPLLGIDPNAQFEYKYKKFRELRYSDLVTLLKKDPAMEIMNKGIFTGEFLKDIVTDDYQNALLIYHYFQLEEIAKQLTDVKRSLNFDTNKAQNSIDAKLKLIAFDEVKKTGILSQDVLNKLYHESVISSFAIQKFNIDFQEQLLPLRNHRVMNDFILNHRDDLPVELRTKNFDKFARVFKNDFISYLFQNKVTNEIDVNKWFEGDNSVANQLYKIKQENPELVAKYPLLNNLVKDKSKRDPAKGGFIGDNVKLVDSNLDTDAINIYQEQFNQLINPDVKKVEDPIKNKELTVFFNKLAMFGFLQSGLNKSFLYYTDIIPQDLYTKLMSSVIDDTTAKLKDEKQFAPFYQIFRRENTSQFQFREHTGQGEPFKLPITNFEPYRRKNLLATPLEKKTIKSDQFKTNVNDIREEMENPKPKEQTGFTVTPTSQPDMLKAPAKASIANKYIGFGPQNGSTALYAKQAGDLANSGNYSSNDTIFVSVPGNRGDVAIRKQFQDQTIKEALKAIATGATLITDNKLYVDSSDYNEGEKRLTENLRAKDYQYSERTVNGQVLGIWKNDVLTPSFKDLPSSNFNTMLEFSPEERERMLHGVATKYKMSPEKALNYINDSLQTNREFVIKKLKECF